MWMCAGIENATRVKSVLSRPVVFGAFEFQHLSPPRDPLSPVPDELTDHGNAQIFTYLRYETRRIGFFPVALFSPLRAIATVT